MFLTVLICRRLRKSNLFSMHPDLMRMMDVHTTVMNVIKTYLSYSLTTLKKQKNTMPVRPKLRRQIVSLVRFASAQRTCSTWSNM